MENKNSHRTGQQPGELSRSRWGNGGHPTIHGGGKTSTLTIDTHAGGCFCEKNENRSAEHMRISFVDPGKRMLMTGDLGPLQGMGMFGALEWTFETVEQGTEVTMTYKVNGINPGRFEKSAPIIDRVQALQLGGLENLIQGNN